MGKRLDASRCHFVGTSAHATIIVLDGDPAPPKGAQPPPPIFGYVCCGQTTGVDRSRCHSVQRQALAQATLCWMGIQLPLKRGTAPPPFRPMSIVAKPLDGSRCHLVLGMYWIGILTIRPDPDSGQIVESAMWPNPDFTGYRIVTQGRETLTTESRWLNQLASDIGLVSFSEYHITYLVMLHIKMVVCFILWFCVRWGPNPHPKRGTAAPLFLAPVYCCQMVAYLSYCWALVQVLGQK